MTANKFDELERLAKEALPIAENRDGYGDKLINYSVKVCGHPELIVELIAENKQLQEINQKLKFRTFKAEAEFKTCYDAGLQFKQERDVLAARLKEQIGI